MEKYYIKDNLIFSSKTSQYELPIELAPNQIEIPKDSKNHLVNNKILINDLQKLLKKDGKKIELCKQIKNYDETKTTIVQNKKKLKKPVLDDYNFIEKTSQLIVIDNILKTHMENPKEPLNEKIENYLKTIKSTEIEKFVQLEEQIEIEQNKLEKLKNQKDKFEEEQIKPIKEEIKNLEKQKTSLQKQKEQLDARLEKQTKKEPVTTQQTQKIDDKIKQLDDKIQSFKFEQKILKAKIETLKNKIKLGQTKNVNLLLFILTLGLIY